MVEISDRRIYLSGPMTGIEDYNAVAFAKAEGLCKALGAREVFNPQRAWINWDGDVPDWPRETFLRLDFQKLCTSRGRYPGAPWYDLLLHLPGWHDSDGAVRETVLAEGIGMQVAELWEVEAQCRDVEGIEKWAQCQIDLA